MDQDFMKKKAPLHLVLAMSLPMVLSMLVNLLYNIIDSYFVARISENAMTALSLVYPLQNLVMAVSVGFGIGINAAAAYYLGAGNREAADNTVSQGVLLSVIHGLVLTFGCLCVMPSFLRAFTKDAETISFALRYSNIVFLFSAVITISVSFEKIFQAVGKMTVSMVSMLCGCVINIILDPIFIFGAGRILPMGIEGAALATGIGQTATLAIYLFIYLKKPLPVRVRLKGQLSQEKQFKRLYIVGIPAALNMGLPSLLITALNGILSQYSQMYVLVLGIYYKLQTFIYLTANGIVQGIRPLVGYNYGAGEYRRVKQIHNAALEICAVVMLMGMAICLSASEFLMGMFTVNTETVKAGAQPVSGMLFGLRSLRQQPYPVFSTDITLVTNFLCNLTRKREVKVINELDTRGGLWYSGQRRGL